MLTVRFLVVLAIVAFVGLLPKTASATVPVSLDLDYVVPIESGPVGDGFGGALRVGSRLDLAVLNLTAEAGFGIHDFSGDQSPTVYRAFLGPRFGLGVLLRPSVYGHIGVGHADWYAAEDLTHLTLDGGVALDLTLTPAFELGAHAAYNYIFGNGSLGGFGFATIGGHFTVVLDRGD